MSRQELEERIRRRAYGIWELEGRAYGNHEGHWHRATKEIEEEDLADRSKGTPRKTEPPH
ncbi:DUF2934 domain-containing protein [Sinorhizobium psoraleae]|uniref:DUF2934 domain-containing protein n=1 Tax=Sinorhizobium psoraleae TaxID=520838 RepID=UPI001FE4453E|nr:DUF2934 domain-containing protein [Sinorhizobium psoraleae]